MSLHSIHSLGAGKDIGRWVEEIALLDEVLSLSSSFWSSSSWWWNSYMPISDQKPFIFPTSSSHFSTMSQSIERKSDWLSLNDGKMFYFLLSLPHSLTHSLCRWWKWWKRNYFSFVVHFSPCRVIPCFTLYCFLQRERKRSFRRDCAASWFFKRPKFCPLNKYLTNDAKEL